MYVCMTARDDHSQILTGSRMTFKNPGPGLILGLKGYMDRK